MPSELDDRPDLAIPLCRAAHQRLLATARRITDGQARGPSRLPGWTVGHVMAHLARNADGHSIRLEGALRGEEVPRYPGGDAEREAGIEAGAGRPAAELAADLDEAQRRLEAVWRRSDEAGWPHRELQAGDRWETPASPIRRMAEVEVHHADLGLGYGPDDWPEEYVEWQLDILLAGVPRRSDSRRRRQLVAWLAGRGALPDGFALDPW